MFLPIVNLNMTQNKTRKDKHLLGSRIIQSSILDDHAPIIQCYDYYNF